MKALNEYSGTTVITLLGEVDTGFVIWYWAQKHSSSLAQSLKRAAKTYCRFIDKIAKKHSVICLSAPLPTISDDNDWGGVANYVGDYREPTGKNPNDSTPTHS